MNVDIFFENFVNFGKFGINWIFKLAPMCLRRAREGEGKERAVERKAPEREARGGGAGGAGAKRKR